MGATAECLGIVAVVVVGSAVASRAEVECAVDPTAECVATSDPDGEFAAESDFSDEFAVESDFGDEFAVESDFGVEFVALELGVPAGALASMVSTFAAPYGWVVLGWVL